MRKKKTEERETVRVEVEFNVPVILEIDAYIDEDGNAQATDVQVGHIQGLTVDRFNECLNEDDFAYLTEIVNEKLKEKG